MSKNLYSVLFHRKTCHDGFSCAFSTQVARGVNTSGKLTYFIQYWLEEHASNVDVELRHLIHWGGGNNIGMHKIRRYECVKTIIAGAREEAFGKIRRSTNYVCIGSP